MEGRCTCYVLMVLERCLNFYEIGNCYVYVKGDNYRIKFIMLKGDNYRIKAVIYMLKGDNYRIKAVMYMLKEDSYWI